MPLPVPLAPAVIVIQVTLLVAVHVQVLVVVTLALVVPPLDIIVCDIGNTVKLHGAGALGSVSDLLLPFPHPAVRRIVTNAKPFISRWFTTQLLRDCR